MAKFAIMMEEVRHIGAGQFVNSIDANTSQYSLGSEQFVLQFVY